mgnify:CR=1 FL=1
MQAHLSVSLIFRIAASLCTTLSLWHIYYALLFDCPTASELAHRAADPYMARVHYLSRPACGLQVHLGIEFGSDGYEAECVEIFSYSDDGEAWEENIRQTLLRLEHVGIWF